MGILEKLNKHNREKSYSKIGERIKQGKTVIASRFYKDVDGNIEYIIGAQASLKYPTIYEYTGIKNNNNEYPVELFLNNSNINKHKQQYDRRLLLYHEQSNDNKQDILYVNIVSHDLEKNYLKLKSLAFAGQTVKMFVCD